MFKPNLHAQAELEADPQYRQLRREKARDVARMARAVAPDGGPHRGYKETVRTGENGGTIAVVSHDPFAHLVEFGSMNNPAYAPLRLGVRAADLDYRDD